MILGEIFAESSVSLVKTVWQKRGTQITRKEKSRLLAAAEANPPPLAEEKEHSHGEG